MPKTLPMARPALPRPAKAAPLWAMVLFLAVYVAILGVLFAPEGFFVTSDAPVAVAE